MMLSNKLLTQSKYFVPETDPTKFLPPLEGRFHEDRDFYVSLILIPVNSYLLNE